MVYYPPKESSPKETPRGDPLVWVLSFTLVLIFFFTPYEPTKKIDFILRTGGRTCGSAYLVFVNIFYICIFIFLNFVLLYLECKWKIFLQKTIVTSRFIGKKCGFNFQIKCFSNKFYGVWYFLFFFPLYLEFKGKILVQEKKSWRQI